MAIAIGRLEDFPDGSATPTRYRVGAREVWVTVVGRDGQVSCYRDECPHMFLPLSPRGKRVLSADGERLRCTNHGAEFAIADGRALGGPVDGCGLTAVAIEVDAAGTVLVTNEQGSASS